MLDYPGDSHEYSLNCFQYDCEQFYWKPQTTDNEPAQTEDKIQTMKIKADRQHDIMTNSIVLLQRTTCWCHTCNIKFPSCETTINGTETLVNTVTETLFNLLLKIKKTAGLKARCLERPVLIITSKCFVVHPQSTTNKVTLWPNGPRNSHVTIFRVTISFWHSVVKYQQHKRQRVGEQKSLHRGFMNNKWITSTYFAKKPYDSWESVSVKVFLQHRYNIWK